MFVRCSDGARVYYRVKRGSQQPVLVFLHGWLHNWRAWKNELAFFERRGFTTIALDLRGHGHSSKPEKKESYHIEHFALDIQEVLEKENIKQAVFVGHSFGGMIALKLYQFYPELFACLVLVDTCYDNPLKHMHIGRKMTPFLRGILYHILENVSVHKSHMSELKLERFKGCSDFFTALQGASCTSLKSVLSCADEILGFNAKKLLPRIKIPVLVIEGEKDVLTPLNVARRMERLIPRVELKIIKGISHNADINASYDVSKEVLRFVNNKM